MAAAAASTRASAHPNGPPLRAAAPGARRNRPPPPEAVRGARPRASPTPLGPAPGPRPAPPREEESPWGPDSQRHGDLPGCQVPSLQLCRSWRAHPVRMGRRFELGLGRSKDQEVHSPAPVTWPAVNSQPAGGAGQCKSGLSLSVTELAQSCQADHIAPCSSASFLVWLQKTQLSWGAGPKGQRLEGTQACFCLLLKYIFWALPTYLTQRGLFGTESWRIKNQ
ncbi:uncharacterized protein LOC124972361 [Sciurus carolinensis]|uniref:uncharacterized protein LOC124972361 n=1 Tax=Sciurus carolinensis TaxID=30640 RepID=UPI001FB4722A|nr:uncharacterized protein LOC124972361 [Sciurus carolinensis]